CFVRSRPRHSTRRRTTRSRLDSSTMSMKSTTMIPPMSQAQLSDDLLGGFEVVAGHGLLEVPSGPGELAGVDVDDGHRLGAVDDERSARRQTHCALQR